MANSDFNSDKEEALDALVRHTVSCTEQESQPNRMNSSGATLLQLSRSTDPQVRGGVATDPRCPVAVLLTLLDDRDDRVSDLAFLNPSLPTGARLRSWEHVVQQGNFESRQSGQLWRVMFTPNAPLDLIERILSHDLDEIREGVPQILKLHYFVWRLLESEYCPADAVARAIIVGPPNRKSWAARNPTLTPELVDILIEEGEGLVHLALNPSASHRIGAIVTQLTIWELLDVARSLEDNESEAMVLSTRRLSEWLLENPEPDADGPYEDDYVFPSVVVGVLADHSSSPEEVSRLCAHENPFVRQRAGRNPIATEEDHVIIMLLSNL